MASKSLLTQFKNRQAKLAGFGSCAHCGDSWAWKKTGEIRYARANGMFPLCAECEADAPFEVLIEYCQKLWNSWCVDDPEKTPEGFPALVIAKSIELKRAGKSQWEHPLLDEEDLSTDGKMD